MNPSSTVGSRRPGLPALCLFAAALATLACADAGAQLLTDLATDPADAVFVYDDVHNFLRALAMLEGSARAHEVLQAEYFDRASPGLKEYARRYDLTAESLARAIEERPRVFSRLASLPEKLDAQEPLLRRHLAGLQEIIPGAVFPPAYFVIGEGTHGASAASEYGLLISVERYRSAESKVGVVVHETVHIQQVMAQGLETYREIYGPQQTLLAIAIREGTADFLTSMVTGSRLLERAYTYCVEHEADLWQRFQAEMHDADTGDWVWRRPANRDEPQDLGYVLGARIVESYYERAADKQKAMREILAVTDYLGFLERSGYAEKFGAPTRE